MFAEQENGTTSRAEVQQMVDAAMPVETVGLDGYGGAGFDRLGMGGAPAAGPQFVELERR